MVEFIECEIRSFFSANPSDPDAAFTFAGLSSYERLLAHACSAYNSLHSRLPDGDSQMLGLYAFGTLGLRDYGSDTLRCKM